MNTVEPVTAVQLALEVMPHFIKSVVDERRVRTYGSYCRAIGLDPVEYGRSMGKAMHAVGAACVVRRVPIAPLYWVERENGTDGEIFERRWRESAQVLPHRDFLYCVARDHRYTAEELRAVEATLSKAVESGYSPDRMWDVVIKGKPKGQAKTGFVLALERYKEIEQELRHRTI